jgi:alkyl sulfatase BDS1-like metallo-beta-lactamase superfamily hydrolase
MPDFSDYQDFFDAAKGFLAQISTEITSAEGRMVWDPARYNDLLGMPLRYPDPGIPEDFEEAFKNRIKERLKACPPSVNKSLWRQAHLNHMHGLFKVCEGVYQARGYDIANLTIIQAASGVVVVDCTTVCETAKATLALFWNSVNASMPVKAIIITHSHADHYGGVQGVIDANRERFGGGHVPVFAPELFMEEAALENAIVGEAMTRRSTYQYASFLPVQNNGTAKVDNGLGKDIQLGGKVSFAAPDCTIIHNPTGASQLDWSSGFAYENLPLAIDGIDFEFRLCQATEAPSEMTVWVGSYKTVVAAEVFVHTLHNILTPRGAQVRDVRRWWKALDGLIDRYGNKIDVLCSTHHWPVWQEGERRCERLLEEHRDCYKYLHDQTVRLINKGYTMLEIAEYFESTENLPYFLKERWHSRGYYGTISHDVRAIYQMYLGWYDMNPSNLNPLPPERVAKRYICAMGGECAAYNEISGILRCGTFRLDDYRWAAELGKHLVFAYPNVQNRMLLARIYERMGFGCEAATWRNMYLVGAAELRAGGPIHPNRGSTANASILELMEEETLYDYIASHFAAEAAFSDTPLFKFQIYDTESKTVYLVEAASGTFQYKKSGLEKPSPETPVLETGRAAFALLLLKETELAAAVENGSALVYGVGGEKNGPGDIFYIGQLFNCVENGILGFNIIMP